MLPKAIILLGNDKGGKTSLKTRLVQKFSWLNSYKGLRIDSFDELKKHDEEMLQKIQLSTFPWILDRFHYPDELIYCQLSREEAFPTDLKMWYDSFVVGSLTQFKTLFVYCTADVQILHDRFIASGETDIKASWIPRIKELYDQWFSAESSKASGGLKFLKLDSGTLTPQQMDDATIAAFENWF